MNQRNKVKLNLIPVIRTNDNKMLPLSQVLFIISVCHTVQSALPNNCQIDTMNTVQYARRLNSSIQIRNISPIGPKQCAKECLTRRSCKSLNYAKNKLRCELNNFKAEICTGGSSNMESDQDYNYYDIKYWSKDLAGACVDHKCPENKKCVALHDGSTTCIITECSEMGFPITGAYGELAVSKDVIYPCFQGNKIITLKCAPNGTWVIIGDSCQTSACTESTTTGTTDSTKSSVSTTAITISTTSGSTASTTSGTIATSPATTVTTTDPNFCFTNYDKCYSFKHNPQSYTDAEVHCKHNGKSLVVIKSAMEGMLHLVQANGNGYAGPVWFQALKDTQLNWVTSGTNPNVYTNWNASEPSSEPCSAFVAPDGKWVTKPCNVNFPFICEKQ